MQMSHFKEGVTKRSKSDSSPKVDGYNKKNAQRVKQYIGEYSEAPEQYKFMIYIKTGYRIGFTDSFSILKSLFMWHNETINIWSHLIGFIWYICLLVFFELYITPEGINCSRESLASSLLQSITISDYSIQNLDTSRIPIYIHFFGGMVCMFSSSTYHLFACKCVKTYNTLAKCDIGSIIFFCGCLFYPICYYIFYCDATTHFMYVYIIIGNLSCFLLIFYLFQPVFITPQFRVYRTLLLMGISLIGFLPIIQYYLFNDHKNFPVVNMNLILGGDILYVFGAVIYMIKIPEKYFPIRFDYCGWSHNIWHLCVLVAGMMHSLASIALYYERIMKKCDC
ncbi:unnamed protein product [Moneuplotes crassus]|uniref:Uncharacterized protein n=1 Tax=Euplotes crassus TaxID=5936 RepID=A0AAD1XKB5_EUPCR|nr:unnamed protein product [Moneuplotes crassus]